MKTTLKPRQIEAIASPLTTAGRGFQSRYPGPPERRQPVHTVYGGAHLFRFDSAPRLGRAASRHFAHYFPDFQTLGRVLELPGHAALEAGPTADRESVASGSGPLSLLARVHQRVEEKLQREPVEDFRIDFEDGFGHRPDAEEDHEAVRAAKEVARGLAEGTLPPFIGLRIKAFSPELHGRSLRTLDLFLTALVEATGGSLPPGFVVTLPKVSLHEEVAALVAALEQLEEGLGLDAGSLRLELMVETPQSLIGARGDVPLPGLVKAAGGRCVGAHFGIYDYTASCGIVAAFQTLDHPACDLARHLMQVSLAGTGVFLSDGATNLIPVGPHRAGESGPSERLEEENRQIVYRVSKENYDQVWHSLRHGFYQGWDLHPAQLPVRYAAAYSFFLASLDEATARLGSFVGKAAQATLLGDVFDDAATGQALLNFFLQGMSCGAIHEAEATRTGLTLEELRTRSFQAIVEGRRGQ